MPIDTLLVYVGVVAVADMDAKVEQAMKRAAKLEQKQIEGRPRRARARRGFGRAADLLVASRRAGRDRPAALRTAEVVQASSR